MNVRSLAPPGAEADPAGVPDRKVTTGAQMAKNTGWADLMGQRVGVITNPTGVLHDLTSIVDDMHAAGVRIVGVFGPEHGFRGTAQAGGSEGTFVDPRTGLTVYDSYDATIDTITGTFEKAGVETLVFDIQDVGARFYTYVWTLYTCMVAAARVRARLVVLDRPNPIGGSTRGPMMTHGFQTFVGLREIVQQHGMTVGELADFFDGEFLDREGGRVRELQVIKADGWRPDMRYADTGLAWVSPSPNMPTPDTALLYPGTCLFEGTTLSEGRGTTRPFELIGAPYVDHRWAERLTSLGLPGVRFREASFTPTFSKHQGELCGGVQVHITDPATIEAITTATEMIVALRALYPSDFGWRDDNWVDRLTGSTRFRDQVDAGAAAAEIVGAWDSELAAFDAQRRPYLLYPGPGR